jgi:hypothetical protein
MLYVRSVCLCLRNCENASVLLANDHTSLNCGMRNNIKIRKCRNEVVYKGTPDIHCDSVWINCRV